jgi:hypothetical protein
MLFCGDILYLLIVKAYGPMSIAMYNKETVEYLGTLGPDLKDLIDVDFDDKTLIISHMKDNHCIIVRYDLTITDSSSTTTLTDNQCTLTIG